MNEVDIHFCSGSRHNVGRKDHGKPHVGKAVYVGAVGARLEKLDFMEWQEIVVDQEQNTLENGYGPECPLSLKQVFASFYDIPYFPTYDKCQGLIEFGSGFQGEGRQYFNANVYRKRIQIAAETFLIEANNRGQQAGKNVHVFVVGLGLGVWKCTSHQVRTLFSSTN